MKSQKKEEERAKQSIDPRQLYLKYRLTHRELEDTIKRLK
jgi:hypothetical protein